MNKPILYIFLFWLFLSSAGNTFSQSISKFIIVDQFGYLPDAPKIAVIKDPITGYDADESYTPGNSYAVVNEAGTQVFTGSPQIWSGGSEDASSGDKAWWFDFTSVQTPGTYYILDITKNKRSYSFKIGIAVYNEILKQAVRTFYYQRAGFAKSVPYADAAWADGASHLGNLQDPKARRYNAANDASTERDLRGGWYDAGDYNKYTNWTANYVVDMMKAYLEKPDAWGDNYNIPESGNGVPDLIDEAKWGMDFLIRMQEENGSVLSIVSLSHASPPSSATGQSLYGTASTSATQNTASAFAIGAKVFKILGQNDYATELVNRAKKAWDWSEVNPSVLFYNNDASKGTAGIGAGQQEEDNYGREMGRLEAACYLFDATGDTKYRDYFDAHYQDTHFFQWSFAYPFETNTQEVLLHYTTISGATEAVKTAILNKYKSTMNSEHNFTAYYGKRDPYMAHLDAYTWGSNGVKCLQGSMFYNIIIYNVDASKNADAKKAAIPYINYIHGVNPQNMVYLSNMYKYGGDNTVNEFYHTWFQNGSSKWDRVGVSTYGPAPGFVTGGPNPSYNWDGCCPSNCGGSNNAVCNSENISPPKGQPKQKSYKDFNTSWPLNSWEVTENSCGYQMAYIRLLSKFVTAAYDCNNELNGSAYLDKCGVCVGGSTGRTESDNCGVTALEDYNEYAQINVYPNPGMETVYLKNLPPNQHQIEIFDVLGKPVKTIHLEKGQNSLTINDLHGGNYVMKISGRGKQVFKMLHLICY